jgi:hypothetical protein
LSLLFALLLIGSVSVRHGIVEMSDLSGMSGLNVWLVRCLPGTPARDRRRADRSSQRSSTHTGLFVAIPHVAPATAISSIRSLWW